MGLLDTRWVERALTKGWLAGAMLTEWPDDLIAPDSPFRTLPNCLITPAMGYNVPDYWQRFARFARQQTEQFLRTATVSDRVDPHLNY
jgi:phosphoglycerate dehydrogenase-like enzyme